MRVLLTTYASRGDLEPLLGLAAPLGAAAAEQCDARVATGTMPTGGWR